MRPRVVALFAVACLAGPAPAAIVYNSRAFSPAGIHVISDPGEPASGVENGAPDAETDVRCGDTITLAGTDRFVTEFTTRVWSFQNPASPVTADVELTLYHLAAGVPGAVIWAGTVPGVAMTGTTAVDVTFNPNVTVPTTLCFAVSFANITGTRLFGVVTSQAVLTGSSPLHTLRQDSATLAWRQDVGLNPGPDVFDHVDARITAVPAPAALAAPLASAVLLRRRRR